ncbi:MAG: Nudix family hydrolase [Proteobacteria bacterium]|nr:Nudix family hydrolase [Pseudomonadota bacterium]
MTRVAAAVIVRPDGTVLLAQRPPGKAYAGYWEFPGGKLEPGETPRAALDRELNEELGIVVRDAAPWFVQRYAYAHAHVELHFFRVFAFDGEPVGHDGQAFRWQVPGRYDVAPLLPANTRVLAALELPAVYGISCAEDIGEDAFLHRATHAFAAGLRLACVREKAWPRARRDALVARLKPLADAAGAKLLLNGDADDARRMGLAGIHWPAATLMGARDRPHDLVVAASCHDARELARAGALGVDFAMLGPVHATPTHPGATPLGWEAFARLVDGCTLPVYALGGLGPGDVAHARAAGAHGVALRRAAWPVH